MLPSMRQVTTRYCLWFRPMCKVIRRTLWKINNNAPVMSEEIETHHSGKFYLSSPLDIPEELHFVTSTR